ncbi:MAG TPA: glutamine synthetase family protein [Thermoleophilia bacterium]|nr:glutamine synthetase family protein [Thermoleophilia bacterium]
MEDPQQRAASLVRALDEAGVAYVLGSFVDSGGINRVKAVPLDGLVSAVRSGIGISSCWNTALSDDTFTETAASSGPSGDLRLLPDLDTLVQLADTPRWAWVALDQRLQNGEVSPGCQRSFLKRMVRRAEEQGLSLKMAYEFEWFMAREESGELIPIHSGPGYSSTAWVQVRGLAEDLLSALALQQMQVEQFHPEYSLGQVEVSLGVCDPLRTADWNVLFRHTVRSVSARHGCRASFSPISLAGQVGNGCHIHFSLWNATAENLFTGGDRILELTAEGEAFLAGVYAELPAIIAVTCPTVLSYHRIQPHHWAGAYHCWGHENREAALRFIQGMVGSRGQNSNMELKSADTAGHPYLTPAVIIAAGLAGLEQGLRLPPPISEDPASLSEDELAARGIQRLPQSLDDAAQALAESQVLRAAMGDFLHDCTVAVRRAEAEASRGLALDDLVNSHLWRF